MTESYSTQSPPASGAGMTQCPIHSLAGRVTGVQASGAPTRRIPRAPGYIAPLAELLTDPLPFFVRGYLAHGPVYQIKVPTRDYVVLAGYDANLLLMREDHRLFDHAPPYQVIARELGASHYPICTRGDVHAHLRRSFRPALATGALDAATPGILDELGRRAAQWAPDERLPVLDLMHAWLGDAVVPALTGRPLGPLLGDAVTFARFSMGCGLGGYPSQLRFAPSYLRARRRMARFFGDLLASHRETPPGGGSRAPDFIDQVLAMTDEKGAPLPEVDLVGLAQMIYSNTLLYVAPAAAFSLYSILSEPGVLGRCLEELDAVFAGGSPALARLQQAEYFCASIKESMRLHPIGLATPRVAKEAFDFEGYHIPEGRAVLIVMTACHYLPELYPDPHRFDPERHLAPRNESRKPGAYAPFGYGAHTCLAAKLVEGMIQIVLAGLLRNARLTFDRPGYTLRKRINPFPEPASDLVLRVARPQLAS